MWAGIALGVAAALEVPALLLIGRLSSKHSNLGLLATGCVAGIAYYIGLAFVTEPVALIALQLLNAWSFAGIAGIGLPLFQQMIPRPGLSTGLYMNTRRIGSIVSGPIIAIGSLTVLGQRGIFVTSAVLTLIGLIIIAIASRTSKKTVTDERSSPSRRPPSPFGRQNPDRRTQWREIRSAAAPHPDDRPRLRQDVLTTRTGISDSSSTRCTMEPQEQLADTAALPGSDLSKVAPTSSA